jgi:signal transduction histidine kinase
MITKEITLINQTVLDCLNENDEHKIVKAFTENGRKALDADYGFVWLNTSSKSKLELIYKSSDLPFSPKPPKMRGRNYKVMKKFAPDYVIDIDKNRANSDIVKHVKSFTIVPITYKKVIYGTMVFCYRKRQVFSDEKKVICVYLGNSVAQAITIHRLTEKEHKALLLSAKQEASLREEKLKNEFIANATHEIRTPLAIIRSNADYALMADSSNHSHTEAFNAINHEVEHLSEIISDLTLLISREDVIHKNIVKKKIDLCAILNQTIKRYRSLANKRNISINSDCDEKIYILGDKSYLEKLFLNLIRNSVNYGKEGGWIKVEARKTGDKVEVEIRDNGIGISDDDIPFIFNRFYRADKLHMHDRNGSGLGLAIVKWIVQAHEGNISVKSTPGEGSIFVVSLNLARD